MEDKLEKYRAKLRRDAFFSRIKQRLINMVTIAPSNQHKKYDETIEIPDDKGVLEVIPESECSDIDENDVIFTSEEEDAEPAAEGKPNDAEASKLKYFIYIMWFCFWATCWMIAIELKFGMVFLLFSALFGIYFNTRTGPKLKNEISAYSVFNKDCKSIKGSLNAEQFEREIRYGPMTVHN